MKSLVLYANATLLACLLTIAPIAEGVVAGVDSSQVTIVNNELTAINISGQSLGFQTPTSVDFNNPPSFGSVNSLLNVNIEDAAFGGDLSPVDISGFGGNPTVTDQNGPGLPDFIISDLFSRDNGFLVFPIFSNGTVGTQGTSIATDDWAFVANVSNTPLGATTVYFVGFEISDLKDNGGDNLAPDTPLQGFRILDQFDGMDPSLAIYVVPEPSTYAAIFGALALALVIWRRR